MVAKTPIRTTTTVSSMSVKPRSAREGRRGESRLRCGSGSDGGNGCFTGWGLAQQVPCRFAEAVNLEFLFDFRMPRPPPGGKDCDALKSLRSRSGGPTGSDTVPGESL